MSLYNIPPKNYTKSIARMIYFPKHFIYGNCNLDG